MYIALNIKNESLSQKVLEFLSSFKKEEIEVQTFQQEKETLFSEFAGLWRDRYKQNKTNCMEKLVLDTKKFFSMQFFIKYITKVEIFRLLKTNYLIFDIKRILLF